MTAPLPITIHDADSAECALAAIMEKVRAADVPGREGLVALTVGMAVGEFKAEWATRWFYHAGVDDLSQKFLILTLDKYLKRDGLALGLFTDESRDRMLFLGGMARALYSPTKILHTLQGIAGRDGMAELEARINEELADYPAMPRGD